MMKKWTTILAAAIVFGCVLVSGPGKHLEAQELPVAIEIMVTADGRYILDGVEMSLEESSEAAQATRVRVGEVRAVILADKDAKYERVVQLMEAFKVVGVKEFALQVSQGDQPESQRPERQ